MSFVPSDLSSIIAHWRSEDIPSGTPDPLNWDDVVSAWRLSRSGTARPTYAATAIGGLPGLTFDAADDYLTTTTTKVIANTMQICIVCKMTSTSANRGMFAITPSATPAWTTAMMTFDPYSTSGNYLYFNPSEYEGYRPILSTGVDMLVRCANTVNDGGVWESGNRNAILGGNKTTIFSTQSAACYMHLGAGTTSTALWLGEISDVVMWNQTQMCESLYIEGYLSHKFGITLPAWHPFYAAAPTSGPSSGGSLLTGIKNKGIRV